MDYSLAWVIVTVFFTQASEFCPPKWVWSGQFNACYKVFMTPKDWEDARNFCEKRNAKLTDLYDYEEQMFIKDTLLEAVSGHGVWVGATDDDEEDDWRWVDNTKVDIDRYSWWQGNPNNGDVPPFIDLVIPGEDCLEISLKTRYRGQLNDYNCEKKMAFICKKKDISTTSSTLETTGIVTEKDLSKEATDESMTPIVPALVSVFLIAVIASVAGIVIFLRRYRKQKSTRNYYEDAHVTPSANENFYTCLDTSDHLSICKNDSARVDLSDQSSIHEYHSVHFSTYESVNGNKTKVDVAGTDYLKPSTPRRY
ncbi:CD302 antigen-like [Mercenaria mercenaria]|uniref:CD302 antigen-like n=1 Tax=Mercenaria mercenaria TaxID=6596 RepID=UPI00234ED26E|nr:CD302 antigen-like [Mercenaria mercenaria]